MSTLLAGHPERLSPYEIEGLENEVRSIAAEIAQTTDVNKAEWIARWNHQRLWKRLVVLPRPQSILLRLLTFTAYVYLGGAILYAAAWPFAVWVAAVTELSSPEMAGLLPAGSLAALLLFAGLRKLCITVARRDIARLDASQRQSTQAA